MFDRPQKEIIMEQQTLFEMMNALFRLKKRAAKSPDADVLQKYIKRVTEKFEALGYYIEDPTGEQWDDTRTDCEASIAGGSSENLIITDVTKPVIRFWDGMNTEIVQQGIAIVQSETAEEEVSDERDN